MPEEGIQYLPQKQLLTYEEMIRISKIFSREGITKIRITGGEPFLRKDLMSFLTEIANIEDIEKISITSNGTLLIDKLEQLNALGINSINLSLDSLDKKTFYDITRRDELDIVLESFYKMIEMGFDVKINMVVMDGKNIKDILPMLELAKKHPVQIRYIEEMPFNGTVGQGNDAYWSHHKILDHIKEAHPSVAKLKDPLYSTSANYGIDGFNGGFGIIAAFSRTFCGTCNRIRLTPTGTIKTCLYDSGVFNIKNMIRANASDEEIVMALKEALNHRAKDGFEAEKRSILNGPISESMAKIGG